MKLSNKIVITGDYQGSTKFDFWKLLKPDDIVEISITLKSYGRGRSGLYAPDIDLVSGNLKFSCSLNQLMNYLSKIEHKDAK